MHRHSRRGPAVITWALLALAAFSGGTAYANDADEDGVLDVDDGCPNISDPLQEDTSPGGPDGAGDTCAHPTATVALSATQGGLYMHARSALGERSTVGPLTIIGRLANVGDDVTIGSDVLIGRGASVGNDAIIGTGSDLGYASVIGDGAELGDRTVVGSLATVGPDAVLQNDVVIARSASVLAQSVGSQTVVGPGVAIASGATVGSMVRIRKDASVGASATIGDGARISRNAVVGEGAQVGSSVTIGVGAVIEPGAMVPDEGIVARYEVVEGAAVQGFGLFAGWQFSCAINADGSVQCWGDGWGGGNLGHGVDSSSNTAVSVLGIGDTLAGAQSIAGDMDGACALLTDGSVYCWGSKFGSNAPTVPISGLTDPVELFGGGSGHTFFCVRNGDGTVQCWGNNRFGQLGNGVATLSSSFSTTPVTALGLTDVTGVARGVGNAGSCVIHATGELSCWGRGEYGELGFTASVTCHSTPCEPTPTKVQGVTNVVKAAVGHRNTCVLFDNGTVDCWGNNVAGQLGQSGGGTGPGDLVVGLPGPATEIGVGTYHACALVSGTEYCWGGSNQTRIVPGPTPYPIAAGGTVVDISPGDNHSCLRLDGGTVKCWGYNDGGSLGNGTDYSDEDEPAVVQGIP